MMNPEDVGKVLAVAAMYDKRTVGSADILAWGNALDGFDPRDCAEAIRRHYTNPDTCEKYLLPGHVIGGIRAVRREAARKRADEKVLLGIAAATAEYDQDRAHAAYLEARQAFAEALSAKHGDVESDEATA